MYIPLSDWRACESLWVYAE